MLLLAALLSVARLHSGPAAAAVASSPLTGLDPPATDLPNDDMVSRPTSSARHVPPRLGQPQNQPDLPVAGLTQSSHVVDVAVIVPTGSACWNAHGGDARVRLLVSQTGDYWKQQSSNRVMSVTASAMITRDTSTRAGAA